MDLSASAGQFSDHLTQVLITPSHTGNVLISPLSLLTALSMLLAGSREGTRSSLSSTLKLPANASQEDIDSYYQSLISAHKTESNGRSQLQVKNKVLVSRSHLAESPLLPSYEKTVREKYDASIDPVDFVNEGQLIKKNVNAWVNESTDGSISELLKEPPDEKSILMLLNCIYFESRWTRRFTSATSGDFLVEGVTNKTVDYMNHKANLKYSRIPIGASNETVQAVAIPYRSNASMIILLPPESVSVNQLFNGNSVYSMARQVITESKDQFVDITLPRFNFQSDLPLAKYLKLMGEENLFSPKADLSGINGATNIKVSKVQHLTAIDVDKVGTKAASTTGIQIDLHMGFASTDEPVRMVLDRPFAFVIYDNDHHVPLFLGKLTDPPAYTPDTFDEVSPE